MDKCNDSRTDYTLVNDRKQFKKTYCCKKHCAGACVTLANKQERLERRRQAQKRQEALQLKTEKARLLKQLEKNKRRRGQLHGLKAEAGIFEAFGQLVDVPGKFNSTLDSMKSTFDHLLALSNKVVKVFDFPDGFDLQNFLIHAYGMIDGLVRKSWVSASIMFYALCRDLKVDFSRILSVISLFQGKEPKVTEETTDADEDDELLSAQSFMDILDHDNVILSFGNIMITVISMMCAGSAFSYVGATKNLADFGRAAIGFTKIKDCTNYLLNFLKDQYYQYMVGKTLEQVEFEKAFPGLKTILERIALLKSDEFQLKFLDTNRTLCNQVVALESDLEALRFDAMRAKRFELVTFLAGKISSLNKIFQAARDSPAHAFSARPAPTTLWVYGRAGTGKSNFVNYFKTRIYAKRYKDHDEWNAQNFSLVRCAENEYWDGYHNQPVILYDDMCQKKDGPSTPNPEIMEFIRAKNEAPYHLHMSSINDKKNVYFNSEYIIATSNVQYPTPTSIADASAFQRRWDISIKVTVNPSFRDTSMDTTDSPGYGIDHKKLAAHIKRTGCGSFVKDVYLITVYDMQKKDVLHADMTLDEFEAYYDRISDDKLNKASKLNDSIMELTGVVKASDPVDATSFIAKFNAEAGDKDITGPEDSESVTEKVKPFIALMNKGNPLSADYKLPEKFEDAEEVIPTPSFLGDVKYNPTTQMASSICESVYEDTPAPATVDEERPWLNIGTPYDAATMIGALLSKIYGTTKKAWAGFVHGYTVILNSGDVITRILTPCQAIIKSFFSFLKSKLPVVIVFLTICGVVFMEKLARHVLNRSCRILAATTFPDLCCREKCTKACRFCDGLQAVRTLGTVAYGMYLTDRLMMERPEDVAKYAQWKEDNQDKYRNEVAINVLKEHTDLGNKIEYATQSRETNTRATPSTLRVESRETLTRTSPQRHRVESRETRTHGAPIRNVTESRELRTRGPIPELRIESGEAPVDIYDVKGSNNLLRAEKQDVVMLEQWESVCSKNAVYCSGNGTVSGTFITGRTLMLPMHFVEGLKETWTFQNPGQDAGTEVRTKDCQITQATSFQGKPVDMAFVTIPSCPSRKNIINMFSTANDLAKSPEGEYVVTTLRRLNEKICLTNFYGSALRSVGTQQYMDGDKIRTVNSSLSYEVDTRAGDCGGLLYARNQLIGGKIIGMHIAGNKGVGVALPLSREFVQRNLANHVKRHSLGIQAIVDARYPFEAQALRSEMDKPAVKYNVTVPDSLANIGNCISLGLAPAPFAATKTNICPSLLSGVIKAPDTKPAHLRSVLVNGEPVDPMLRGVAKVLNSPGSLDSELLSTCVADVEWIHMKHSKPGRVLSYEEAIVGSEDDTYITPLNRTSSPGYPYCLGNDEPGKRKWFGYDSYTLNTAASDEIRDDVFDLIHNARAGRRGDVVWLATLKDERRPVEKVDAIKTRVFAAGPMHYTIAVRMYFLDFVAHIMKNRIDNEVGVGTNPYSIDWHRTATRLTEKGEHVIAGDFSNYDGSLLQDVMWQILDMINRWYDDGPENAQVRAVLFEEICNARVMVKGEIVQWTHSQPSGNPLTVIINSIFNQIIMRYAYLLCKKSSGLPMTCNFTDDVTMQTYGDDNVLNISELAIDWYNQQTITAELARIGMTYTDEGKTGQLIRSRKLEDVSYLKRKFVLDNKGYYSCPLDIGVCYEMANWIRGKSGKGIASTMENGTASLRELYFHGREVFDKARTAYARAMMKYNPSTRFLTYDELHQEYTNNYYC